MHFFLRFLKKAKNRHMLKQGVIVCISLSGIVAGLLILWLATFRLPDLNAFEERKLTQSTKLYDRTGKVLLYDVHEDIKRTVVLYENISRYVKNATVAIEDAEFYSHKGIKPKSIVRAIFVDVTKLQFSQGGSTITQQVIKNALLNKDKKISRKLKEWVLALKLEKVMTKEQILGIYLNEVPYGGNLYGIEEASQAFFGKTAKDVSLAEASYLAALPQAPTYYSPYGNHREQLEARKNLVLAQMLANKFITQSEYDEAKKEKVTFAPIEERGIKAPHFVFYVKEYLEKKYGEEAIEEEGLKVITTLDYELQKKAQESVKKFALQNEKDFKAKNAAMAGVDPKTGQILIMVGSRDYFDKEIEGNFNVTLAHRQPGSAFKPFAYAEAFEKGYLPETVVFDLKTEFSTACTPQGEPRTAGADCYMPVNYDNTYRGPISLRDALAQSINIPAIKVLYLAGLKDTLTLAKNMGIESLDDRERYGLTLVLGGGEVSLLDLTSAYGVFANNGIRNPHQAILRVEDKNGTILEQYEKKEIDVLAPDVAATITDILSDNAARTPAFGAASPLYFPGRAVAVKTGTTNDYHDAWIVGYTPSIALGAWVGNNDNKAMERSIARFIVAPMWNEVMKEILSVMPAEEFEKPLTKDTTSMKPAIRGLWQGAQSYFIDKSSGKLATTYTPLELREERVVREIHSILHWVDRENPLGPPPQNPANDPQYTYWETPIRAWAATQGPDESSSVIPNAEDDTHRPEYAPQIKILHPTANQALPKDSATEIRVETGGKNPAARVEYYVNGTYIGFQDKTPFNFTFTPSEVESLTERNVLKVVVQDTNFMRGEQTLEFAITE